MGGRGGRVPETQLGRMRRRGFNCRLIRASAWLDWPGLSRSGTGPPRRLLHIHIEQLATGPLVECFIANRRSLLDLPEQELGARSEKQRAPGHTFGAPHSALLPAFLPLPLPRCLAACHRQSRQLLFGMMRTTRGVAVTLAACHSRRPTRCRHGSSPFASGLGRVDGGNMVL